MTALIVAEPQCEAPHQSASSSRRLRGGLVGSSVFAVLYGALATQLLPPPFGVLLLALLVVAIPVSDRLTRRTALTGATVLGWAPALWMIKWPFAVDHGALVVAALGGGLAGWVFGSPNPRWRLRSCLPSCRGADVSVVAVLAAALLTFRVWLTSSSPRDALQLLLVGYDNSAHFDMFRMIRRHGTTMDLLAPPPDGSGWSFGSYPQAFHSLLATFGDLLAPEQTSGPEDLVLYVHVVAIVLVASLVVIVSALVSMPVLSGRGLVALPAIGVTATAFLLNPGAAVVASGFANFWFAAASAVGAVVLALSRHEHDSGWVTGAVTGLTFSAALSWTPLALLALPALLIVVPARQRSAFWNQETRSAAVRRWTCLALLSLCLLGFAKAALLIAGNVTVSALASAQGETIGVAPTSLLGLLMVAACSLERYVRMATRATVPGDRTSRPVSRTGYVAMTPVIGVVALAGLLVVQLHATGTTSYYFLKLLLGFELILGPVTAAVLASIVALRCPRRPIAPKTVVAALMITTLTTQLFGYVAPTTAPMLRVRATASDAGGDLFLGPIADGILRAASSPPAAPSYAVEYLAMGGSRSYSAVHPASWFHALSSTSTHLSQERLVLLSVRVTDVEDAAPVVRSLLEQFPTARVVVDPRYFVALRDAVGPSLASGVLEWGADSPQSLE